MSDLCLGWSTFMAVGMVSGFSTFAACCCAMFAFDGKGPLWPWWLFIATVAIGTAALGVAMDQPHCKFQRVLEQHEAERGL